MLETDATIWSNLGYAALVLFIGAGIFAFIKTKKLFVGLVVAGVGLVTGMLLWMVDQDNYFDIAVIKGNGTETTGQILVDQVGGTYTFANGQTMTLKRGENDSGALIINDTDHYAMVVLVYYGNAYVTAPDKVEVVIKPGETLYTTNHLNYVAAWDNPNAVPKTVDVPKGQSGIVKRLLSWADFEPKAGWSIYDQEQAPAF